MEKKKKVWFTFSFIVFINAINIDSFDTSLMLHYISELNSEQKICTYSQVDY